MTGTDAVVNMSYSPSYISGKPQFRQPTPSEKDKIRTYLFMAMIFFFISGITMVLWSIFDFATYSYLTGLSNEELKDYFGHAFISATEAELQMQMTMFLIYGTVKVIFGVIGFILGITLRSKAITPLNKGEYEEASRFLNVYMVMGFIFGLVLSGILIFLAIDMLRKTAKKVAPETATGGQGIHQRGGGAGQEFRRCPVCNSMMTYNTQTQMWFCSQCNRYQ